MNPTTYTVRGYVRGFLSRHRKLARAALALRQDRLACQRAGGYSDARIVRADGEPLSGAEADQVLTVTQWS